ncbi:MAG: hypothetical protein ACFFB3_14300 [Candidatus Hodarchaeota archaeon]
MVKKPNRGALRSKSIRQGIEPQKNCGPFLGSVTVDGQFKHSFALGMNQEKWQLLKNE